MKYKYYVCPYMDDCTVLWYGGVEHDFDQVGILDNQFLYNVVNKLHFDNENHEFLSFEFDEKQQQHSSKYTKEFNDIDSAINYFLSITQDKDIDIYDFIKSIFN